CGPVQYRRGGRWVDYTLRSTVPGLFVLGEANFSDHGANRLGASALMQGLADGYFVLPNTITDYLADLLGDPPVPVADPVFASVEREVDERVRGLLAVEGNRAGGRRAVDGSRGEQGKVGGDTCGRERSADTRKRARGEIPPLREEFHADVRVLGENETFNQSLEKAGRVADFLEFAELMCLDALHREESCGGHFRVEHQTDEGEALRDDDNLAYVAAWEFTGVDEKPNLHKEELGFQAGELAQRSYK